MVLQIAGVVFNAYFPTKYTVHIVLVIIALLVLRGFSQGRSTDRERDLHGRKIMVTGGFTPLGLTILQSLAERGAHVIALSPHPIEDGDATILITLLRSTFSNEHIYAEHCDLTSPSSIRSFCTRFLTGDDQRIDALVLGHEYHHVGGVKPFSKEDLLVDSWSVRDASSLATFLLITLLLPALLVSPVERDIRIVTLVNPFYAAAAAAKAVDLGFFLPPAHQASSLFLQEGKRALRTAVLMRHLQRVIDALPTASQVPKAEEGSNAVPVVSKTMQTSNIVSVSVSPGISRMDTIGPLLNADWTAQTRYSPVGVILYILLQPALRILTKSPKAAMQTVLHALFLPTPFKVVTGSASDLDSNAKKVKRPAVTREEVLKPGALYAECAVVELKVPTLENSSLENEKHEKGDPTTEDDKKSGQTSSEVLSIPEDSEFGGEKIGRLVWEAYETALKTWEKSNPNPVPPPSLQTQKQSEKKEDGETEKLDVYG